MEKIPTACVSDLRGNNDARHTVMTADEILLSLKTVKAIYLTNVNCLWAGLSTHVPGLNDT